jgi:WD40 repeat protein
MDNITPLSGNDRGLLFASAREGQDGKLQITKRKRLVLYSLVLLLIFFLSFCFGFYKGWVGNESPGRALPKDLEETQETAQTVMPFSAQDNKINRRGNDFVYIQDNQLWLGKADNSGAKPVVKKIADQTVGYVLSNSRSKIAYVDDGYLKVRTILSGEEIMLRKLMPDDYLPSEGAASPTYLDFIGNIAWSSDDSELAFVGGNDAQADIYTISVDGRNLKRLTDDRINEISLVWSPDNQKIAFQTTTGLGSGAGYDSNIVVMNSDGGNYSKIVIEGKLPGDYRASPAENLRWIDNDEISFLAWTVGGYQGIWKANVNTKQITPLVNKLGGERSRLVGGKQ